VWWDSRIETGENWMACIKRALNNASTVVVVWTPKSVRPDGTYVSEVVAAEAEDGRNRDILLPVRIMNAVRPFPHNLRNEENLSEWQGNVDDPSFERLAGRISSFVGDRTPPDPEEMSAWLSAEEANNADAYRAFLDKFPNSRFKGEVEPRVAEVQQREADLNLAVQAARRITEQFAVEVRKPTFVPPIGFTKIEGREQQGANYSPEELFDRLKKGGRFELSAIPGGGKTVTLIEWASAYCDLPAERLGVFLRLKEFAKHDDDFFEHLARLDGNGHISADAWKALARSGILTLFCDGWNELSEADREKVGSLIDIHARNYPFSGIVIGTRPIAPPPFSGPSILLSLKRLSFDQVKTIILNRLGQTATQAIAELRQSEVLRDLVRTPFFLSAFCETREAGIRPTTREGLIKGLVDTLEQLPHHSGQIRAVLHGQQGKYLTALAVDMIVNRQADLGMDSAMRVINETSQKLQEQRIFDSFPDALVVLNILRDHHCLIEASGNRPSYRFQHQLIEEWYASTEVRRVALESLTHDEARRLLDEEILNNREWAEAVIFAVETSNENEKEVDAIAHLILRAIGIEPDFAATLIASAPPMVWQKIAPAVHAFIESLLQDSNRRVVQFVMQCGRDEFSDIVWDTINAEKSRRVPDALENHFVPHPAILGPHWWQKCIALNPEQRADLLSMLVSSRSLEGALMALNAALEDHDPKVQKEVAEELAFFGFDEELRRLLEVISPETWEELVRHRIIDVIWEEPWRQKAMDAAQRVFTKMESGPQRISFALSLRPYGLQFNFDIVDELLQTNFEDHHNEAGLYEEVAKFEGKRLSQALIEKVLDGQRVTYRAARLIQQEIQINQAELLDACKNQGQYRHHEILSRFLDRTSLNSLFEELHNTLEKLRTADGGERKTIGDVYRCILDTITHANKNVLAETILDLKSATPKEIGEISEVIMRAYRVEPHRDEREPLDDNLRNLIIQQLGVWAHQLLNNPDCERNMLNRLAEAIAIFPSTSLLDPLRRLLSKDLEIWKSERQEFEKRIAEGKPPDPNSGARMGYTFRYGQNLLSMAQGKNADIVSHDEEEIAPQFPEMTGAVIDVLSDFLRDPLFG